MKSSTCSIASAATASMAAAVMAIRAKRKLQQDAITALGGESGGRKWVKRGELEHIREKQYFEY